MYEITIRIPYNAEDVLTNYEEIKSAVIREVVFHLEKVERTAKVEVYFDECL